MNKKEIFDYLNSGADKSGSLKKVGGFRKNYTEMYNDFLNTDFPDEIKNLPFKQKLWHFLNDVYTIPVCKVCGKPVNFLTRKGQWGYCTYCSASCAMNDDLVKNKMNNTKYERYGDCKYNNVDKQKETLSQKSDEFWNQRTIKSIKTRFKKNNGKYFSYETIDKLRNIKLKSTNINVDNISSVYGIKELLIDWCLKNKFPGNTKWCAEHPIWDCYVGNRMSPKEAWSDRNHIKKAIDNILWMLDRNTDEKFNRTYRKELSTIKIKNNEIVYSSDKLLQLVLYRFTVAKIAPKVTAISGTEVNKIIEQSGIDISNGVYVPMAGFGGIRDGVDIWSNNHNKTVDVECYDINDDLCSWYGWTHKDILSDKIKTDKVCICCPPFGKNNEHWKGTPREMSEKSFVEWYELIKEQIDAPYYIIIGPEIDTTGTGSNKGFDKSGNKMSSLFSKTSGVMMWTDDMLKILKK